MIHINKWEKKYSTPKDSYNIGDYIKLKNQNSNYFHFCKIVDINDRTIKVLTINNTNSVEIINIFKSDIKRKLKPHEIDEFNIKLNLKY